MCFIDERLVLNNCRDVTWLGLRRLEATLAFLSDLQLDVAGCQCTYVACWHMLKGEQPVGPVHSTQPGSLLWTGDTP